MLWIISAFALSLSTMLFVYILLQFRIQLVCAVGRLNPPHSLPIYQALYVGLK